MRNGRGLGKGISVARLWRLREQDGGGREALVSASGRVGAKADVVWEDREATMDEPCPGISHAGLRFLCLGGQPRLMVGRCWVGLRGIT